MLLCFQSVCIGVIFRSWMQKGWSLTSARAVLPTSPKFRDEAGTGNLINFLQPTVRSTCCGEFGSSAAW